MKSEIEKMAGHFTYTVNDQGMATLLFDRQNSKVNTLSYDVMEQLSEILDEVEKDRKAKVLIIQSGKKTGFIAGADISEFLQLKDFQEAEKLALAGQQVLNKLSSLPMPSIAVIDGVCLGGGLEFALACSYRLVVDDPKTTLGLPEVSLGLVPGWGGTQRLPRLIGLEQGMKMVLSGKPVNARKAYKIGLADAIVARPFVQEELTRFCRKVREGKGRRPKKGGFRVWALEKNPIGRSFAFQQAEKSILQKTKGHYKAPLEALRVLKTTYGIPLAKGLKIEAKAIAKLFMAPGSRNLIRLFFNSQALKKDPGLPEGGVARTIQNTAVLGAGIMGGGISWLLSKGDKSVLMKDLNWEAVATGYRAASDVYRQLIKKRRYSPNQVKVKMHHIQGVVDFAGFDRTDLVIEAIVEDLNIKQKAFAELEQKVRKDCIIGSNTSSLSVEQMAKGLQHPERFIGIHFFNPVNRMHLVEVVPGSKTDPDVVVTVVKLLQQLKKSPIVVKDCAGFLVNRILMPYLNESGRLLDEGVDFEEVDKIVEKFGMPMGPYRLADEIGLDVAFKAAKSLESSYGERMAVPALLGRLVGEGIIGKKGSAGFYTYRKKKEHPREKTQQFIQKNRAATNKIPEQDIVPRLIYPMINEAYRCLEEKIVTDPGHLDMAMILGTGFPPFRGGLLAYAESIGLPKLVEQMKQLQERYGSRFAPSEPLLQEASKGVIA